MTRRPQTTIPFIALSLLAGCRQGPTDASANVSLIVTPDRQEAPYLSCVAVLAARDTDAIVAKQLRFGEARFYWTYAAEGELLHPPAITGCSPRSRNVVRADRVVAQDRENDLATGAERACLDVAFDYKMRFNRSMATIHPASIAQSCAEPEAQLDRGAVIPSGAQSRADALSRLSRQRR